MPIPQQLTFIALLVFSIGGFAHLLIHGQDPPKDVRQTEASAPPAKQIKKVFKQNCVKCHGANGAGQTTAGQIAGVPDFTDPEWQGQSEDRSLESSITHGRGEMPPFGQKLTKPQIKALVSYVRRFKR